MSKAQKIMEQQQRKSMSFINWQKPPPGWVALNSDGSVVLASGSASAGGVIRDSSGQFMKGFSVNLGGGSITHAELSGIAHGLHSA
ncbi:unnamed protein product [Linum tenue]|uniref:RNase H type-1 domain-containing protein n=1 Tax=Linum tenue TaxID=586396 RepID=A0AAV0HV51_9ROSI|nr:unnamed protein product [Linum tenue]